MEIREDHSVIFTKNEAIVVLREQHRKHMLLVRKIAQAKYYIEWTMKCNISVFNKDLRVNSWNKKIGIYNSRIEELKPFETAYELLFKNKRIKPNRETDNR